MFRSAELLVAAVLAASMGCGGSNRVAGAPSAPRADSGVTRFRLPLSTNPVDPAAAFRCHGACQQATTPENYSQCLSQCPGFEQTPGAACEANEVPPMAACFTARAAPVGSEPRPGSVVVAVIVDVPLIVSVSSICASQTEPCSYAGAGRTP